MSVTSIDSHTIIVIAAAAFLAAALFGAGLATGWILSHRTRIPAVHRQRLLGR